MKRMIIILGLLFSASLIIEAQNKVFFIRAGVSQFTGFIGGEVQVGHFALEGGWAGLKYPGLDDG